MADWSAFENDHYPEPQDAYKAKRRVLNFVVQLNHVKAGDRLTKAEGDQCSSKSQLVSPAHTGAGPQASSREAFLANIYSRS